jgi:hypothetical protein
MTGPVLGSRSNAERTMRTPELEMHARAGLPAAFLGMTLCVACAPQHTDVADTGPADEPDAAVEDPSEEQAAEAEQSTSRAPQSASRCASVSAPLRSSTYVTDEVDLLFVIDNSGSMTEEQRKLSETLPKLVKVLTWGPDHSLVEVEPGDSDCADVTFLEGSRFLRYEDGETDLDTLVHSFSCIVERGRNGCGLEQPLDAALKALTPPDSSLRFCMDTRGRARPHSAHSVEPARCRRTAHRAIRMGPQPPLQ